jgi:hypothetical protein
VNRRLAALALLPLLALLLACGGLGGGTGAGKQTPAPDTGTAEGQRRLLPGEWVHDSEDGRYLYTFRNDGTCELDHLGNKSAAKWRLLGAGVVETHLGGDVQLWKASFPEADRLLLAPKKQDGSYDKTMPFVRIKR